MNALMHRFLDPKKPPKLSAKFANWQTPRFQKMLDSTTGVDAVFMLISSPTKIFDDAGNQTKNPNQIADVAKQFSLLATSKWAQDQAAAAANWSNGRTAASFIIILEHAASGAYATQTQHIKDTYSFENKLIGPRCAKGFVFENHDHYQCWNI